MALVIRMPQVAADTTEARLAIWSKQEGQAVLRGDCLAEIESDKAIVELAAEADGVMGRQAIAAGETATVGQAIGILLTGDESRHDAHTLLTAAIATPQQLNVSTTTPEPPQIGNHSPAAQQETQFTGGRLRCSPVARRLAAQLGLDLLQLRGTGPNGRIVKRDIELASRTNGHAPTSAVAAAATTFTDKPHSAMRRTIARRLSESKATIPHFYLTQDCRVERLTAMRAEILAMGTRRITLNDYIVRAAALAMQAVPEFNVGWTEQSLRQYQHADIAIAVATGSGLLTPVLRQAEQKSLSAISSELADLAQRARAERLRAEEYQGGSLCISNLGMYGVQSFHAIINPPQAAILAVGAVQAQPVVEEGALVPAKVMKCTLSVDHRAIDGALAAQWLKAFQRLLESPLGILL